jgi:hypothetical protein
MKHVSIVFCILCSCPTILPGDDAADRALLAGNWAADSAGGNDSTESWTITEDREQMNINHSRSGDESVVECNTVGRECQLKDSGREIRISMWFNGPKLVQMETRGSDVVKRRFRATEGGQTLEVETIPIVPTGKAEITRFKRIQSVNATNTPARQPR